MRLPEDWELQEYFAPKRKLTRIAFAARLVEADEAMWKVRVADSPLAVLPAVKAGSVRTVDED